MNAVNTKINDFIQELTSFAETAENTLVEIRSDMEAKAHLFSIFTARMIAIRGTADQLALPHVSHLAGLGEEISVKASSSTSRPQIRKCVGALWDALTTIKHLLEHHGGETKEEQDILINRLESTLTSLGGRRETFSEDEISKLIESRNSGSN